MFARKIILSIESVLLENGNFGIFSGLRFLKKKVNEFGRNDKNFIAGSLGGFRNVLHRNSVPLPNCFRY